MADRSAPGTSSLWLVPPPSPLTSTLQSLISTHLPTIFASTTPSPLPDFAPHVTLTADTVPTSTLANPQQWLNTLQLGIGEGSDDSAVRVDVGAPAVGEARFRKLALECGGKGEGLGRLAGRCRGAGSDAGEGVEEWVRMEYRPHVSLMYSEVESSVAESKLEEVVAAIRKAKSVNPGCESAKRAEIWLVPTYKPVAEWQPIAVRRLENVGWTWESS